MVTLPLVSWWLEDPEFNSGLVHYLSCLCVLQLLDRITTCYTEAPGFWPFPSEFLGKTWEFPWKWKPKWLRLQPNAFHRNSMEFHRIPTFQWESGAICRNSRRVKTSWVLSYFFIPSPPWIPHGMDMDWYIPHGFHAQFQVDSIGFHSQTYWNSVRKHH